MVPQFHDPLDTRAVGTDDFQLLNAFAYTTLVFGAPKMIQAPKGFITDFASIPRLFRSLIPVNGKHRGAAVIHDYLYRTAAEHDYSRKDCDRVFLEGMLTAKERKWRAWIMYNAVRAGGWIYFNQIRNGT